MMEGKTNPDTPVPPNTTNTHNFPDSNQTPTGSKPKGGSKSNQNPNP
jgi:hypothetical protein